LFYSHLEDYINNLYKTLAINNPRQLDVAFLAKKLDLQVYYGSMSLLFGNNIVIKRSTKQQEWQEFGHEIGHYLRHVGNHLSMHTLFVDLQEYQADNFAYHFCIPTFMLKELRDISVYTVSETFGVDYEFARHRLDMHNNKLLFASGK